MIGGRTLRVGTTLPTRRDFRTCMPSCSRICYVGSRRTWKSRCRPRLNRYCELRCQTFRRNTTSKYCADVLICSISSASYKSAQCIVASFFIWMPFFIIKKVKDPVNGTPSDSCGVSLAIWDHSVTCHPTQVNTSRRNPSQTGRYSIYLTWRDGRLSWPSWLITYRDGLPARRWSVIQVLTGSSWSKARR